MMCQKIVFFILMVVFIISCSDDIDVNQEVAKIVAEEKRQQKNEKEKAQTKKEIKPKENKITNKSSVVKKKTKTEAPPEPEEELKSDDELNQSLESLDTKTSSNSTENLEENLEEIDESSEGLPDLDEGLDNAVTQEKVNTLLENTATACKNRDANMLLAFLAKKAIVKIVVNGKTTKLNKKQFAKNLKKSFNKYSSYIHTGTKYQTKISQDGASLTSKNSILKLKMHKGNLLYQEVIYKK